MGAKARTVDMSNVKERSFNVKHLPEGDYKAKVTKVEDHKSKAKNDQWLYTITVTDGRGKGASYPYYCGLEENQLWKVRNLFVAAGINLPKQRQKLDPNKVVGRPVGISLVDDEYEGKEKSVIDNVMPISEVDETDVPDAEDGDEEVAKPKKKKKDKAPEPEPEPVAKKNGKAKKGKHGKKAKEVSDDELQELEVEAL